MITALFLRTAIMVVVMIAVLTKCTIYEDYDDDRSPHKNVMSLSLYRIVTMLTVLFVRTVTMIAVFTKNILYLSLYEECDHDHNLKRELRLWSQFS